MKRTFILFLPWACASVCILYYALQNGLIQNHPDENVIDLKVEMATSDAGFKCGKVNDIEKIPISYERKERWTEVEPMRPFRELHNANQNKTVSFLLNNFTLCKRDFYNAIELWNLIIVVVSKVDNFLQRNTIRSTWASELSTLKAAVVFLVGKSVDSQINKQVAKEAKLYRDVVQVDLIDDYNMLSFKSLSMLQWLNDFCSNFRFYLKADDDTYINVENVLREFKRVLREFKRGNGRFFLCHVFKKAPPIRKHFSKWFVSTEEFSGNFFPTYCSGSAYGFTSSILSDLYRSALQAKLIRMEDVFITGIAAEEIDVSHIHSQGFAYLKRKPTGCAYRNLLSGHKVTVREMELIFAQLKNKEIRCDSKQDS